MIDPFRHLGAVSRRVSRQDYEGQDCNVVEASRAYRTDARDLWDAITNPERIPRWFLPISGDLRLGGRYQLEGNAGGVIRVCEPPHRLAVTWEFGGGISWLEVELAAEGEGTRLTLRHLAPIEAMVDFWTQYGPGATGVGWDLALIGLGQHVEEGAEALDRAQALAWSMSEEGKACARRSAGAWGEAAVEAGEEPAQARAAAGRTAAFYTGEAQA